ncbi:MAG TPA: hypothetical protein VI306_25480 [Pyrinomonadaceae bacterium]
MLRTIAISLMLLLTVGVMLPFANEAHGVRQSSQAGLRQNHRYRSHSWWRRYRARLRKKRAAAALAHRQILLGQPQNIPVGDAAISALPTVPALAESVANVPVSNAAAANAAPAGVSTVSNSTVKTSTAKASDTKATVKSVAPKLPGEMNLSVVALSRQNPVFLTPREEAKMLGGTNVSDLRRIVIDKMLVSGGWVTNDFVREVNGARVFVVTAHTPKSSNTPEKAWTFYFTEADGRIYSLTTDAPVDAADLLSNEAERFINKLHAAPQNK